jgi:hypothetical protein
VKAFGMKPDVLVRAVPRLSRGLAEAHVLALERLLGEEPDDIRVVPASDAPVL